MLIRRAAEAGYGQVTPHQFRHTFSHDWLVAGGSEGDLMRLNGWKTRAMIDRYSSLLYRPLAARLNDEPPTLQVPLRCCATL